jgi:hypothetical protein
MKKIPFLFLFLCPLLTTIAQDESKKPFVKENYPKVYSAITVAVEKEWPDDYDVQLYTINLQCDSFYEYISLSSLKAGIPDDIFKQIKNKALKEWSKTSIDAAYTKCRDAEGEKLLDCFYSTLNPDWSVIIYTINNQIESYRALK